MNMSMSMHMNITTHTNMSMVTSMSMNTSSHFPNLPQLPNLGTWNTQVSLTCRHRFKSASAITMPSRVLPH